MSTSGKCKFYRDSEGIGMGRGIGHCDLDGYQTICDGDIKFCEKPDALKEYCIKIIRARSKAEEKTNQENFFKNRVNIQEGELHDDQRG